MKHGTAIQWTHVPGYKGETWNPVVGCSPVSEGCQNCYAARLANRFKTRLPQYEDTVKNGNWTGRVNRAPDPQFYAPINWRDPRAIFVCSMSDFFHPGADEYRESAWRTIHQARQHLYLILTKRSERILECLPSFGKKEWPWPNVWLGATVENQEQAEKRPRELMRVQAAVRFLSVEPMLEQICIPQAYLNPNEQWDATRDYLNAQGTINWVIAGGESGPGARPMHPVWARSIRDQCQATNVPFFLKQHGEWSWAYGGEPRNAKSMIIGGKNNAMKVWCVGKKRAGRLLDGRLWNEFPNV